MSNVDGLLLSGFGFGRSSGFVLLLSGFGLGGRSSAGFSLRILYKARWS